MKKIEIFGLWLCLLSIMLAFLAMAGWAILFYIGLLVFLIGSYLVLVSLWNRRKDP